MEKTIVVLERQLARKVDDSKAEKDQFLKEIDQLRTQLENLKGKRVETKCDNSSILGKPPLLNNERDQLLKQIASLESKLASQDIRSCQKEYHELRTSYNALKVKFDSLNRKKWNINVSKSSKPKESVSEKVHTGESSKTSLRRVSQFTTYSLQKDRKFFKKSQSFETFFPQKGFKTRASNAKNQSFETSHSCFTPVKQVWRPIKESPTFEVSTSQKSFMTSTLKGQNQVFVTPHSRFTPVKQVWRPKQSHSKSFKYSKLEMLSMQNKNDFASTINMKGRFSNDAKTNFRKVSSNDNNKWKSSSSIRFKTPHETPSFNNQWKIERNFKSLLIPRDLFSNETPVSSSRWNSTSLHRIDTTLKWFSKLGKPVRTVLKWVPKSRRKQKKNTEVPHPSNSTADILNEEHVPTHSNDLLLNGEDRMKLTELMDMCTKLSERVLDLEHTKTAQAQEIINLKLRVKKLEKKAGFRTHNFKRLYKVGATRRVESSDDEILGAQEDASKQERSKIEAIDRDAKVTLVESQRRNDENDDNLMFDTGIFDGDEIVVETEKPVINLATTTKSIAVSTDEIDLAQEITLAQALSAMKSEKPKEKDVWINSFVPIEEDLPSEKVQKEISSEKKAEGSSRKKSIGSKRAKDNQEQESSKRQE
ncbi:hypothetical protein Tco_0151723 [Tanacetum coccineum]